MEEAVLLKDMRVEMVGDDGGSPDIRFTERMIYMFTGLIEETGILKGVRKGSRSCVLTIGCKKVLEGLKSVTALP